MGHQGVDKVYNRTQKRFDWPGLKRERERERERQREREREREREGLNLSLGEFKKQSYNLQNLTAIIEIVYNF